MPAYRPILHFSPPRGWMNDPNGLVWHNEQWHLCYQYAPEHTCWDIGMHWGHAVSRDLTRWEHWPIAFYPDEHGSVFSGSTVVAKLNEDLEGLVACYTYSATFGQVQCLAFSTDDGKTWAKYGGNPVLTLDRRDFRDPKVFRFGSAWRMIIAAGSEAQIYASANLRDWTFLSTIASPVPDCTWECPDLMEIEGRWILIASLIIPNSLPKEGNNSRYYVGAFDGTTFTAESGPHPLSFGPDDYAAVSWSNVPNGRKVIIGWMSHWNYANLTPTQDEGWRGAMTLPRVLSFSQGILKQQPPQELRNRRGDSIPFTPQGTACQDQASEIEIEVDLALLRTAEAGIRLRNDANELVEVIYNRESGEIFIDRTRSGKVEFHPDFAGVFRAPLGMENDLLKLDVFVDSCSVEVFAQDGRLYGAALVFPSLSWRTVEFVGDAASIRKGALYSLAT